VRQFSGDLLAFIYLTQFEAEQEIEDSLRILEEKGIIEARNYFFHLRWQDLPRILNRVLSSADEQYKKAVCNDLKDLMDFKNLLPFTRFSQMPEGLVESLQPQFPVFLDVGSALTQQFKGFTTLPTSLSIGVLSRFPVLFRLLNEGNEINFNGFSNIPERLNVEYHRNVYYGGVL
jgi:hypothetical protein